jgi:DNA-binding response OmpR family regulator/HPt (histidine-containing phosphotransfer) domain-containing protein
MRILLVEDDDAIANVLERGFINEHYAVDVAKDGHLGWQLVKAYDYDLIVLDVMLPKLDGIEFCQRLRDSAYQMPVLMVTALDSSTRKIAGLNAGADDYITKPFELEELLTRARVLLRRAQTPMLQVLEWGDLQLDPNTREVAYGSQTLSLTPKEYRLLELFLRKQSQVFSRGAILDSLWNCGEAPGEDTVTAHIKGLRRKLTDAGAPSDLIKTVYGVGYRLKPQESSSGKSSLSTDGPQQSAPPQKQSPAPKVPGLKKDHREQTRAALQSLWHTTRSQQEERLATIKRAVTAAATGQLTPDLHEQAQRAAHSLKGALGVFGLAAGSELAQLIEQALANHSSLIHQPQMQCWVLALQQELIKGPALPEPETPQPTLPLLVVIDDDSDLADRLASTAQETGLVAETLPTKSHLQRFRQQISMVYQIWLNGSADQPATPQPALPDLGLFNFPLQQADEASLATIADLIHQIPPLQVLVCSADGSLDNRIKAARLGPSTFLHNPDVSQILSGGVLLRSRPCPTIAAKVMIVDDDPQLLSTLHTLLEPLGTKLTTLNHPASFWQTLQSTQPDLLVLDVEMPDFSGLDLCRVVRQTSTWQHLPIVFLTGHADPTRKHTAMLAGANDFIDKSLPSSDLIHRLFYQLQRTHLQHTLATLPAESLNQAIR